MHKTIQAGHVVIYTVIDTRRDDEYHTVASWCLTYHVALPFWPRYVCLYSCNLPQNLSRQSLWSSFGACMHLLPLLLPSIHPQPLPLWVFHPHLLWDIVLRENQFCQGTRYNVYIKHSREIKCLCHTSPFHCPSPYKSWQISLGRLLILFRPYLTVFWVMTSRSTMPKL